MLSFLVLLGSRSSNTRLLLGERSRSYGFYKEQIEAPIKLTIYIFTKLLLDYIQYLHIVARLVIYYMLCL